jgi:hypothetical protein
MIEECGNILKKSVVFRSFSSVYDPPNPGRYIVDASGKAQISKKFFHDLNTFIDMLQVSLG